jgi:Leucine-rich repeat (LRR) protein
MIHRNLDNTHVGGLILSQNKYVCHLPESVDKSFPNLMFYAADNVQINNISKLNFEGLNKLRRLFLSYNQIENITTDTFEDLVALEVLVLCEKVYKFETFFNFSIFLNFR